MGKEIMKTIRLGSIAAVTALSALLLAGCAANEEPTDPEVPSLSGTLNGSGASSQGKAQDAWRAGFQTANQAVTVNYDGGGSGAGRDAFAAGSVDFAGSDRAFKTSEIQDKTFVGCAADSGLVELPLYISPMAIAFKLEGINSLNLDAETLAKIFSGQIAKWNDPAIASQNAGVSLPDLAITYVFRGENSGTTENFVDYLKKAAPAAWPWDVSGDWPEDLKSQGEAASETSGVVTAISGGEGYIGYLDASRAGDLGTIALKVGDSYTPFSPAAAAAVVDDSSLESGRTSGDLVFSINRTTTKAGAYPLILISYLVGCETYADAAKGELVKAYFNHMASEAGQQAAADNAGSAPISSSLRAQVEAAIALIK